MEGVISSLSKGSRTESISIDSITSEFAKKRSLILQERYNEQHIAPTPFPIDPTSDHVQTNDILPGFHAEHPTTNIPLPSIKSDDSKYIYYAEQYSDNQYSDDYSTTYDEAVPSHLRTVRLFACRLP